MPRTPPLEGSALTRASGRRQGASRLGLALACGICAGLVGCGGSISDSPLASSRVATQSAPPLAVLPRPPASPEHSKLVATYGGIYTNAEMEQAVYALVQRLVSATQTPNRGIRLTILNSPVVNAFALPSGDLYLTRGLITLANDESELAAVIAHELAHVTADHAQLRQRQAEAAALAKRVSDVVADPTIKLETRETAELSLAAFSQRQELQADEIGVETLAGANFDPFAASRFLETMARYAALPALNAASEGRPGFLSSHPSTPARVANAKRAARRYAAPGIGRQARDVYLKTLDGALYGDDPSQGYVRGREFAHVTLGIAFEVPENYVLRNTAAAVLATDGQHTAIRFDNIDVPKRTSLADYLRSGWVKGLIDDSVRPTKVHDLDAATASALVDGWSFRIGVIRGPDQVYRFIFASSKPATAYEDAFRRTLASFRLLSPSDKARMRPLTIRIVKVARGDTVASLATRMDGVADEFKRPVFETINGLGNERALRPGMLVKLVVE